MPAMMSLLVIMRRDMLASTRRAVAMLSSAPCSVSRACVIVCRCLCRSCRMLTPSSCAQRASLSSEDESHSARLQHSRVYVAPSGVMRMITERRASQESLQLCHAVSKRN